MQNTQIQLGNKGFLDTTGETIIPLNYSIAPIQDISKKKGGFSKTINLPGTKNNHKLFGSLYNVNIATGVFDINVKEQVIILQNGIPVFEGWMQLLEVVKSAPTVYNGDEIVTYNVSVQDTVGDFYSAIADKLLTQNPSVNDDINLSQWDHIYNFTNVLASFTNDYKDKIC